ncbi:hypothetical protein KEM48_007855 [Puccinia striiformis f. sp. tritici PST-130]|nr:hypothetical protein H4Q26_008253 [Puccinia striiformis f. sp. tritici PST-130]KAI9621207.1 hypothetical protein KEM48_007855 [Puccinia striiformis f. sp. tritici PST-130]
MLVLIWGTSFSEVGDVSVTRVADSFAFFLITRSLKVSRPDSIMRFAISSVVSKWEIILLLSQFLLAASINAAPTKPAGGESVSPQGMYFSGPYCPYPCKRGKPVRFHSSM